VRERNGLGPGRRSRCGTAGLADPGDPRASPHRQRGRSIEDVANPSQLCSPRSLRCRAGRFSRRPEAAASGSARASAMRRRPRSREEPGSFTGRSQARVRGRASRSARRTRRAPERKQRDNEPHQGQRPPLEPLAQRPSDREHREREQHLVEPAPVVGKLGVGRQRVRMAVADASEEVSRRPVVLAVDDVADPSVRRCRAADPPRSRRGRTCSAAYAARTKRSRPRPR
jgi:hypothetical protein